MVRSATTETAPPPASTSLALRGSLDNLERVAREVNLQSIAQMENRFDQAATLADGIGQLRQYLTSEVMGKVMRLQNSPLGFRTDAQQGYPESAVKDCLIEATLRGLLPVGNQWNILANRCYVTKEGFTYLMAKHPGLTDVRLDFGVPTMKDGGAVVKCKGSWKLNGQPDVLEAEIPVKVNSGMGVDAVLGKAERKLRARIYNRITGTVFSDGEVDDDTRAAAAKNVTPPTAQERVTSLSQAAVTVAPDEDAQRAADFAAEEAERLKREPGED